MNIVALDVDYRLGGADAAAVVFGGWTDHSPTTELRVHIESVADYEPGSFFLRELPCLLRVLTELAGRPPAASLSASLPASSAAQPGPPPEVGAPTRATGVVPIGGGPTFLGINADVLVIDGYVDLAPGRPGLGHHLFDALGGSVPVIGVAKTRFHDAPAADLHRGGGGRPLYITAVGLPLDEAVAHIATMHGPFRIPTLLKRVDALARGR